jgi:hypothetical protein
MRQANISQLGHYPLADGGSRFSSSQRTCSPVRGLLPNFLLSLADALQSKHGSDKSSIVEEPSCFWSSGRAEALNTARPKPIAANSCAMSLSDLRCPLGERRCKRSGKVLWDVQASPKRAIQHGEPRRFRACSIDTPLGAYRLFRTARRSRSLQVCLNRPGLIGGSNS